MMCPSFPRRVALAALVAGALLVTVTGCAPDADNGRQQASDTITTPRPSPLTDAEEARAREVGSEAAVTLQSTLAPRLMAAMQEGGPAHAVEFCAGAAEMLTDSASRAAGFEVKRTSSRVRNPANAPDRWEEEVLRRFEALAEAGDSLPPGVTQAVSEDEMRFYAPMRVGEVCVRCHGEPDELAPGVTELLAEEYPEDRATGYAMGDFRGVIRVSIPRDPPGDSNRPDGS